MHSLSSIMSRILCHCYCTGNNCNCLIQSTICTRLLLTIIFSVSQVEQLHKIYKLCGSPSDEYWKKYRLPNATLFKPREPYRRCIVETFKDFPPSSMPLIETLLAIDPVERKTATAALKSEVSSYNPISNLFTSCAPLYLIFP